MPFFFFPLPKVPCNATTTCNGHGSCTSHGDCQCDDGFYAANCSGKLSLNYSIIKIFFEILNTLFEQLSVMLPKTAVIKESVDHMELVTVILLFTEKNAQVNLEDWRLNIQFIFKLTFCFKLFHSWMPLFSYM